MKKGCFPLKECQTKPVWLLQISVNMYIKYFFYKITIKMMYLISGGKNCYLVGAGIFQRLTTNAT